MEQRLGSSDQGRIKGCGSGIRAGLRCGSGREWVGSRAYRRVQASRARFSVVFCEVSVNMKFAEESPWRLHVKRYILMYLDLSSGSSSFGSPLSLYFVLFFECYVERINEK